MEKPTILIDMDEVLVDFMTGACLAHGWSPQYLASKRKPGVWCLAKTMGLSLGQFWQPINKAGEPFWLSLRPLPWMGDLLQLVDANSKEWHIVSSPSHDPSCYSGKVAWLKNYFGNTFDRFVLTPHKHLFAKSSAILIDDKEENTAEFCQAGGKAVLFPSLTNLLSEYVSEPVDYVKFSLMEIKQCT